MRHVRRTAGTADLQATAAAEDRKGLACDGSCTTSSADIKQNYKASSNFCILGMLSQKKSANYTSVLAAAHLLIHPVSFNEVKNMQLCCSLCFHQNAARLQAIKVVFAYIKARRDQNLGRQLDKNACFLQGFKFGTSTEQMFLCEPLEMHILQGVSSCMHAHMCLRKAR